MPKCKGNHEQKTDKDKYPADMTTRAHTCPSLPTDHVSIEETRGSRKKPVKENQWSEASSQVSAWTWNYTQEGQAQINQSKLKKYI